MQKNKGIITVEATLILPVYIIVILFIVNFLNIFYLQLTIQQGLNNAGKVLAQYCYIIELSVGMDNLALSEETKGKETKITSAVNEFSDSAQAVLSIFNEKITISNIKEVIDAGKSFWQAGNSLKSSLTNVTKDDIVNYVLSTAVEGGGGTLLEYMVDAYLDEMKVNKNFIEDGIQYRLLIDSKNAEYSLILATKYKYKNPMFSLFLNEINMKQSVVVHPWIGGKTKGIR